MPDMILQSNPSTKDNAIRCLWRLDLDSRRSPYLYCILDAARDERIHPGLSALASQTQILSLYQGSTAAELADVAPYLVCMGADDRVFDWMWEHGWGDSWGIFLWSTASPSALRSHFRRFTKVRTESGKSLLFRFYDPRVASNFLPICNFHQLKEFFGPVTYFYVEDEGGESLTVFGLPNERLTMKRISLHENFRS